MVVIQQLPAATLYRLRQSSWGCRRSTSGVATRSIDGEVPRSVLIHLPGEFYSFDSFWAAAVPGRVGSSTVDALLSPPELGTLFLAFWVYCSCAVSILGPRPTVSRCVAELMALEAVTESKFC